MYECGNEYQKKKKSTNPNMSKQTLVAGPDALELGVARTDDVTERGNVWEQLSLSKEVLSQGCLWKRKRSVVPGQQWARRWFILRADDCLYSFKSENVR